MKAEKSSFDELNDDKRFEYRSYGKGELAMMYFPHIQQQSAVDQFNKWLKAAPGLMERLFATGMSPCSRRYTPAQVRLIVEVLQEP